MNTKERTTEESNRAASAIIAALEGNFRKWLSCVEYAQAMPIIEEIVERELAALRAKLGEACDLEHEKHTLLAVAEGRCELLERENAALALVVRKMLLHFPAALNGITTEEELRAAIGAARKATP